MRGRTEEAVLESGPLPASMEIKQIDQDGKYDVATLPKDEDIGEEVSKNAFLSKRTEALMMTAICTALFGEFAWYSSYCLDFSLCPRSFPVAGWNDASTGPLIPSLQGLYHVSSPRPCFRWLAVEDSKV
jgi:hypothetical protein